MVGGNPPIMQGFMIKIMIRIKRVYFHERHVDLMWYGKRGIGRRIKGDYVLVPWSILDWICG
jgi:hypothetical protein